MIILIFFRKRKSSIYKGKPLFSIFSVGDYSFYPYKIAISGLYKYLNFKIVSPLGAKPVMVDDTCNFIPCKNESEAFILYSLLSCDRTKAFLDSIIFWDSKRPITTEILNSIDLKKVAKEKSLYDHYNTLANYNKNIDKEKIVQMELM